jgi:hypothetical protein
MKTTGFAWAAVVGTLLPLGWQTVTKADEVVAFGLTNRAIGEATIGIDPEFLDLLIANLDPSGQRGVSIQLGQADSGLFFSPYTHVDLNSDEAMSGDAFGWSDGVERRLVSVFCRRADWATYPVTVDFLPLGSAAKTVQVFIDQAFLGEETYTNGEVTVYTSNNDQIGPRVNPLWRGPDGSMGVLLEFTDNPPIMLPSGRYAYANRVLIRPENPTSKVDYVTRVDIYGGGSLPEFSSIDERLGMFGLPHRALGEALFLAAGNKLTLANCADAGTDGVMIELRNAAAFRVQFEPVSLETNGALFHVSASPTYDYYYPQDSANFLGPLGIDNASGEKLLRVDAGWQVQVEVFDGETRVGGFVPEHGGYVGGLGTNQLVIVAAGASGAAGDQMAALYLQLREPATLTNAQVSLRGDRLRISPIYATNDVGTFVSFQVLACGVAPFTITNELASPSPRLELAIAPAGTNVVVSWPAYASRYSFLETIGLLSSEGHWSNAIGQNLPSIRSRTALAIPLQHEQNAFFRLRNPYAQIIDPAAPPE